VRRAVHAAIAAAAVVGCVLVIDDNPPRIDLTGECGLPDGDVWRALPDGGLQHVSNPQPSGGRPSCPQFGEGDSGYILPPPDSGIPEIGSGKNGDNGTVVLVMLRVDQGTANLADGVEALLKQITDSLVGQDFGVLAVAIAEMYAPQHIWVVSPGLPVKSVVADVIRTVSASRTAALPTACATAQLQDEGAKASSWSQNGITPFRLPPAALLVVLIDAGARPQALSSCETFPFSADPVYWLPTQHRYRLATRFVMIATPESGDAAAMRSHCLAVPSFPTEAIDVIAPSAQRFFDPWSVQLNTLQAGLATRADLCDALGTGGQQVWDAMATQWRQQLEGLR
jgi:hypothetical protein